MKYHRYNKKTARKRFPNKQRMKVIAGCTVLCIALLGESCLPVSAAQNKKDLKTRVLERAELRMVHIRKPLHIHLGKSRGQKIQTFRWEILTRIMHIQDI